MCVLVQFLSSGKEVRLGLVVEGGGRVPGSCVARPSLPGKGAPLLIRACSKESGIVGNLLIQHTVSRWCSSGCVHEGCGGVHHWLQTEN